MAQALTSHRSWSIRRVFVTMDRHREYLVSDVARVIGVSRPDLRQRIKSRDIAAREQRGVYFIGWPEIAFLAMQRWSLAVIEDELGEAAANALPSLLRTRKVVLALPAYQVEMIHRLAQRSAQTADAYLTTHLLDLASAEAEEMEQHVPGFGAALRFPHE